MADSPYKTVLVNRDLHQKIKVLASLEGQSITDWIEWMAERAYQAAMRNRTRKVK